MGKSTAVHAAPPLVGVAGPLKGVEIVIFESLAASQMTVIGPGKILKFTGYHCAASKADADLAKTSEKFGKSFWVKGEKPNMKPAPATEAFEHELAFGEVRKQIEEKIAAQFQEKMAAKDKQIAEKDEAIIALQKQVLDLEEKLTGG